MIKSHNCKWTGYHQHTVSIVLCAYQILVLYILLLPACSTVPNFWSTVVRVSQLGHYIMFEIFFKQIGYIIKFRMSTQKKHTILIPISITQYNNKGSFNSHQIRDYYVFACGDIKITFFVEYFKYCQRVGKILIKDVLNSDSTLVTQCKHGLY